MRAYIKLLAIVLCAVGVQWAIDHRRAGAIDDAQMTVRVALGNAGIGSEAELNAAVDAWMERVRARSLDSACLARARANRPQDECREIEPADAPDCDGRDETCVAAAAD